MDNHINIVSFNIPFPANYGGVIDVYYKMCALHRCGAKIILHCFEYERPRAKELESLCEKVYYYKRKTGLRSNMTLLPYNVFSRKDPELLANLLANDYPILFDGLHSCYYLSHPLLQGRLKIYRACNIEHDYYRHLAKGETDCIKRLFFLMEAWRFERYQKILSHADIMLAVSTTDTDYLCRVFPHKRVEFMPCFHGNNRITARAGVGNYILYHGKLSVAENALAAMYLVRNVFSKLTYPCIIAGMNPPASLVKAAAQYPNISVEANPSDARMDILTHEAQVHMLVTFQDTGLKLKLLNSLFCGRHTVANRLMTSGSGLESLCHIADTPAEMISVCERLMKEPVTDEEIARRTSLLFPTFSNTHQGERLFSMICLSKSKKTLESPLSSVSEIKKRRKVRFLPFLK